MKKITTTLLLLFLCLMNFVFAQRTCGSNPSPEQISYVEKAVKKYQEHHPTTKYRSYDTLPVVVHIVYKTTPQNLDDSVVMSQLQVLNEDFNRLNADSVNTPTPFDSVAGSMGVWFQLATFDPNGNPTTGITHTQTTVSTFSVGTDDIKYSSLGGVDAWNTTEYINIWVGDISAGLLGYAQFPGGNPATDGVVISYEVFGKNTSNVQIPYNLGRTTTHELAHYLGLYHIWGDDGGSCTNTDHIADTPNQAGSNFGCPTFPVLDACSPAFPGVMFMNYMDYTDDACMNLFTEGQVGHMNGVIDTLRSGLRTSNAFTSINSPNVISHFSCYPNPVQHLVNIVFTASQIEKAHLSLMDLQGKAIISQEMITQTGKNQLPLSLTTLAKGTYLVTLEIKGQRSYQKLIVL